MTKPCSPAEPSPQEISARNTRYAFYQITPYYGYMIRVVYCYEQIESDTTHKEYWILRGYFPIDYTQYMEALARDKHSWKPGENSSLTYLAEGTSIKIQIYGDDLFYIKSSEVPQKR